MNEEIKSFIVISLTLLISCINVGCAPQSRPTQYDPTEYSSVASEILDSMQNGAHGLDSDLPWYTDICGYVNDGVYCNENLMFSIEIPEDWHVYSLEEMGEYGVPSSTARLVFDAEADHRIDPGDEVYDLICDDSEGHRISVLLNFWGYNPPYDVLTRTHLDNIMRDSRTELEAYPTVSRVTRDDRSLTEVNGQPVYMITWTLHHEDGSETYRTEIIDFYPPCTRVIAIEYNSPEELDDYISLITYQADNTFPDTEETTS